MNNALFTSKTGLWETPQEFFDKLKFGGSRNSAPFHGMCF